MKIGTPLTDDATRVMLLGSGELGKEVAIELQRLGVEVIAADRYADAPAMQVAHRSHVIDMLDAMALRALIAQEQPHLVAPEIEAIPEAKAAFLESMDEDAKRYLDLAKKLEDGHTARLMAEGMPEKQARAKASKQANEDARFVLPNACETKMVMTMNCRSLLNFFNLRCCNRAQWEIRAVADEMLRLVLPVAPHIFAKAGPACVSGPCPEGKMCCGRTAEVRAKYEAIKQEAGV